jgi:hypothetical protein
MPVLDDLKLVRCSGKYRGMYQLFNRGKPVLEKITFRAMRYSKRGAAHWSKVNGIPMVDPRPEYATDEGRSAIIARGEMLLLFDSKKIARRAIKVAEREAVKR